MLLLNGSSWASHISGGSIKYSALPNGSWYLEASVFRDCAGASFNSASIAITATCTATLSTQTITAANLPFVAPIPIPFGGPYSAVVVGTVTAEEVSDVCDRILNPNQSPNTNCRGGTVQGYTRFNYSATVTLAPCNYWIVGFSPVCCRNTGSSNVTSGSMWVETWFDSQNFPTNSSPKFADEVKPIPSACVGKTVFYGIGTVDPDGDSLRFELACPKQSSSQCVTYASGYSYLAPAPGLKLDSATGLFSFTPQAVGKRVVAFWVKEYERCTGVWKAQTLRDVQFRIETCTNNVPRDISGVSNLQGKNTVKLGKFKIQACNGSTISFEDTIYDADATDTLVFNSNYAQVLPGATMSLNFLSKNKCVVKYTWTASIGLNPHKIFYLVFNDDRCNYPGNGFSLFEIQVRNSTSAGDDQSLCLGRDTAYIEASGGRYYRWTSVWGDTLRWTGPNKNIWADTTANDTNKRIKFLPNTTTYLEVWSDMKEGCVTAYACQARDTIKIVAAKNYNLLKQADTVICFNDSTIPLWVNPDSAFFTYSYKWKSAPSLSNDSISNPNVTPITTKTYYVTVSSDSGCVKEDSIKVEVTPPFPANIYAVADDSSICKGTKAQLNLQLGYKPSSCGITQGQCSGAPVNYDVGAGLTVNLGSGASHQMWPCPYGGEMNSARQQYLYLASEMRAAGIKAGIIQGLSFNVKKMGSQGQFANYRIKLKCTNQTVLSNWVNGTVQVMNPKSVSVQPGWNYHPFDFQYDWDGQSNLVVEVCWSNGSSSGDNSEVYYTQTAFNSCMAFISNANACSASNLSLISNRNRPNIKINLCQAPDSNAFKYSWIPSTYLNATQIKNPVTTPQDSITYYAHVTDTFGKCDGYSTRLKINLTKITVGSDTVLCPYDTVQISIDDRRLCPGPKKYLWIKGHPGAYISVDTIPSPRLMAIANTDFIVSVSDTCGCSVLDTFTIKMRDIPPPALTKTLPKCGFSNGSLKVVGSGGISPYTYQLSQGGVVLGNNQTGNFGNLNNGYYSIRVTDAGKCYNEVLDTFTNTAPIIDSITSSNLTCYRNNSGEIDVYVSSGIPPYVFSIDSGNSYISANSFKLLPKGRYHVMARSFDGCITKPVAKVLSEPDSLYSDLFYNEVSCFGAADARSIGIAHGGTQPYSWKWASGSLTDTAANLSGGWDTLTLSDVNGCKFDTSYFVQEFPEVIIDSILHKNVSCFGYNDGSSQIIAKGGKQALFYSITGGAIFSPNSSFSKLEPKGYSVRVEDVNGCFKTDTLIITEPKEVRVFSNFDTAKICVSTCIDMLANATGGNSSSYEYHWTPGITSKDGVQRVCPEEESTYWVYSRDTAGCISTRKAIRVNLYDSLKVVPKGDLVICYGENIDIPTAASGGDGAGFIYSWFPQNGLSDPNSSRPNTSPDTTTNYMVVLTDICGSPADTAYAQIIVNPLPLVGFTTDSVFVCHPGRINFTKTSPANSVECTWRFGDGNESNTCTDIPYVYRYPGLYSPQLIVTDENNCTDSLTKDELIRVARTPSAYFTKTPDRPTTKEPVVQFYDKSEGWIVRWEWTFGSFDTSAVQNPKFTFPETHRDKYPVKLTVWDTNTCVSDTIIEVRIGPEFGFYIPSAFTPNGDGQNDVFRPLGTGVNPKQYEMIIFNRWGEIVFETKNFEEGWDGTDIRSGTLVPAGIYPYRIRVGDTFDEKDRHEYQGSVTIYSIKEQ